MNCEGDEGPAVTMFGGIPAFGGHSLAGSIERAATLTAKDTRMDIESETFFIQPNQDVAGTLRSTDGGADVDHGMANHLVAGTLQSSGKAAGSATGQVAVCITWEVTHTLKAEGFDGSEDGTGRGQPIVAAFAENSRAEVRLEGGDGSIAGSLGGGGGKPGQGMPCIAYSTKLQTRRANTGPPAHTSRVRAPAGLSR
jgi:DNA (cytosine-5)-methyltransferase 1